MLFFTLVIVLQYYLYITLLLIANPQAIPVDSGVTIKPIPGRDNVIELDIVAITKCVSNDFNIIVNYLYFLFFFFDFKTLSLKQVIISVLLIVELLNIFTSLKFLF